ncbi:MAG: transcriptional repressor [Ignavibacteriales bacterium]|nr:MAG: transcriptional repressor [Ignavibacteriaceae bacterium]MBW7873631.1 transcriptional repressor [Ignavibacteria bacterium]MCZ2143861.1 transcriptional repressor [Ignavibacteriales bacterium]OQY71177.1 MAG: transcriptional repressor [Ignavibacteriales bacterium UTCHB3]MBZ0196908.1 transcriptional repressor [Ignavibacteriaceae bacterium]
MKNQQANELFRDYLKRGNNRITPERFEVLDAALEFDGHFSADELFISMKNNNSRVSRATVYNTLELLCQAELLSQRNFSNKVNYYESNYKRQNHFHLVCIDCGRIVEFTDKRIEKISKEIGLSLGFKTSSYSYNIFARCDNKSNCPFSHDKSHS